MGRLQPGYPLWLRAHWIGMKLQFPLQKIGLRSSARHRISEPVSPLRLYPARLSGAALGVERRDGARPRTDE